MTRDSVLEWMNRRPFRPFHFRLSNGESYQVRHPEMAAVSLTNVVVFSGPDGGSTKIALLHVAAMEEVG
jgi:hypothetical protein